MSRSLKSFIGIAAASLAFLAFATSSDRASAAPDLQFIPIHVQPGPILNPRHFLPLDEIHYVSTEIDSFAPTMASTPLSCGQFFGWNACLAPKSNATAAAIFDIANQGNEFSVDLGSGNDLSSVLMLFNEPNRHPNGTFPPGPVDDIFFARHQNQPLLHLAGFVGKGDKDAPMVKIQGSADYNIVEAALVPAGVLVFALQVANDKGEWQDAAIMQSPPVDKRNDNDIVQSTTVSTLVPEFTAVRFEIRNGSANDPTKVVAVAYAQLLVTTCVPDAANPGQCL